MEYKNRTLASLIVGAVVGLMCIGYLLIPVIDGTTETIGTETDNTNAGVYFSDAPATIKCTSAGAWTVDGVEVTDHSVGYLLSDAGMVAMSIGSNTSGILVLSDGTTGSVRNIIVTDDGFSYATISDANTYIDVSCEYVYYSANSGDYALYTDSSFNVDDGENVIAFNKGSTGYFCAELNNSVVNFFCVDGSMTDATIVSDATITEQDGYSEWSSSGWTVTYGDDSTLTGTNVIAPATYTVRTEEQNILVSMLYLAPLLLIIAVLVVVMNRVKNE